MKSALMVQALATFVLLGTPIVAQQELLPAQNTLVAGPSPACAARGNEGCFAFYVLEAPTTIDETILSGRAAENGYCDVDGSMLMSPGRYILLKETTSGNLANDLGELACDGTSQTDISAESGDDIASVIVAGPSPVCRERQNDGCYWWRLTADTPFEETVLRGDGDTFFDENGYDLSGTDVVLLAGEYFFLK